MRGEESELADSCFPYMIDLGLTLKSPYSPNVNSILYCFAKPAAILIGNVRPNNAVCHELSDVSSVIGNSLVVGYIFAKRTSNQQPASLVLSTNTRFN